MTAVNILLTADAAHVFTDGAYCGPDGAIRGFGQKVLIFAHLSAAIVTRGSELHSLAASDAASGGSCCCFEDLLSNNFFEDFNAAIERYAGLFDEDPFAADFDMVLAGWSDELGRAVAYSASSQDQELGAPDRWTGMLPFTAMPMNETMQANLKANGVDLAAGLRGDEDAVALMAEQRAWREPLVGGGLPKSAVGAFVQHTSITRHRVESRVIHRWPEDVLDQPIGGVAP